MVSYHDCSREQLAVLVPELLLSGHLIDRSGMPQTLTVFDREGMVQTAIEEWQIASPVYTRRMQDALGFRGDDVVTIFKGLQLDIGAPPQFMDFRYRVHDRDHGEFQLDHCGALMDVEPMGEDFVNGMCHDIEDPTFDATALATNPHAQVRPIHRPPRRPADRTPHCAWTVTIDPANTPPPVPRNFEVTSGSVAAGVALSAIDPAEEGRADYSGPLLSDIRFADFSRSALVRIAEEVCLQHHLLVLAFRTSLADRLDADRTTEIVRKQFAGIAGLTSERLRRALGVGDDAAGLVAVLQVHPALNPRQYVDAEIGRDGDAVRLRIGRGDGATADGVWPALLDGAHLEPLDTLVRGVNPRFVAHAVAEDDAALTVEVTLAAEPFRESTEVALTRFSTGAGFAFADRGIPLPLIVR